MASIRVGGVSCQSADNGVVPGSPRSRRMTIAREQRIVLYDLFKYFQPGKRLQEVPPSFEMKIQSAVQL